jgi:hypothetical protein
MPTGLLEVKIIEGRKLKDTDVFSKSVREKNYWCAVVNFQQDARSTGCKLYHATHYEVIVCTGSLLLALDNGPQQSQGAPVAHADRQGRRVKAKVE